MKRTRTLIDAFGAGGAMAGWWKKHGRSESGSETFEFALCANIFFLFCFGFLELCLVLFSLHCVGEASRQTARWASVRGTSSNSATGCLNPNISTCPATVNDIQSYAQAQPGLAAGNTQVTVNWCNADGTTGCTNDPSNAQPGHIVKVTVTYTYASVPFFRTNGLTLTSTAAKVIWQ